MIQKTLFKTLFLLIQRGALWAALCLLGSLTMPSNALPLTFTADFAVWNGPPLVKTKFGVYQTPLITLPELLNATALLEEINVHDFRYEIGWGKPDVLAHDQISGTAAQPHIDFAMLDAFTRLLAAQRVKPLFALTYCPDPLKSRQEWAAWKDMPGDLSVWQGLLESYVAHLRRTPGMAGSLYEIWNEPDMPEGVGKMFFTGSPQDYLKLYAASAPGVRRGDSDALVGGAAIAYDLRYFTPLLSQPLDFASIHAYEDYASHIRSLRSAIPNRPELPILLTEYASFNHFGREAPVSRHPGAERFFRDARQMLNYPDVAKVYWAQWIDDALGMVTKDGHRKALFNAFKIYGMMPVDRNPVLPDGADSVNLMASSDEHNGGVVVWNENTSEREVTIHLKHLPFSSGLLEVYRIDADHASYIDKAASENLSVCETFRIQAASQAVWTGKIPAESVVYLKAFDSAKPSPLPSAPIGNYIQTHRWFFDRASKACSDFDPQSGIARLDMGDSDFGLAQIGAVIEHPAGRFAVQVKKEGPFQAQDSNALFGLRLDFSSRRGGWSKSVLFHNGLYNKGRSSALPWGQGGAAPDVSLLQSEMNEGKPFLINLARIAPPDWDQKRVLLSFILQNAGRGSKARITLTAKESSGAAPGASR